MARNFKGKNSITSARALYQLRAKYKIEAYPEDGGFGGPEVKDLLFVERSYYGTIDADDLPIVPKSEFLKPLFLQTGNRGSAPVVLDFVAEAFKEVQDSFRYACRAQLIDKSNPYIVGMNPVKAYTSPIVDYEKYLSNLLRIFNEEILKKNYNINNITNFDKYVNTFLNYTENNPFNMPLTLSKWCRSNNSSIFHSALAIDVAGLQIDSDQEKIDFFIDDPRYEFYSNIAINKGFSVVKNAPWILLADLQSPGITKFISSKYGFKDLKDLFKKRFDRAALVERDIISRIFYRYYNFFTRTNQRIRQTKVCGGKTSIEYSFRYPIPRGLYNEKYDDDYWIGPYIKLRINEDNFIMSEYRFNSVVKRAKHIKKTFDSERMASYIEKVFGNQTWNKPYGYDDLLKSQKGEVIGRTDTEKKSKIKEAADRGSSSGGMSSY